MQTLKQDYEKLAKKYGLPAYAELDENFELLYAAPIYEISHPLSFVRRKMNDKLAWVCIMLQSIIQPNPSSMINMQEAAFFSKEQKEECQKILKELIIISRTSVTLDIDTNEKKDAEHIKTIFAAWNKLKPRLLAIAQVFPEGWKRDSKKEFSHSNYTG